VRQSRCINEAAENLSSVILSHLTFCTNGSHVNMLTDNYKSAVTYRYPTVSFQGLPADFKGWCMSTLRS